MGNSQGASQSADFESCCRRFSESELENLKKLYKSLAVQSRSNGEYIIASVFQAYFGIHGSLGSRLFDLVTQSRKDQKLRFDDLVIAKAKYEKGSPEEVAEFMYKLVDLNDDGIVDKEEFESVVLSILETVLGPAEAIIGASLPESSMKAFVNSAHFVDNNGKKVLSYEDFRCWYTLVPSAKRFLANIFNPPAPVPRLQVPRLLVPSNFSSVNFALRREHAWHIAGMLQPEEIQEWVLLYHSSVNGFSFNTFLSSVKAAEGCTVLVIKDQQGCIYGGYASQPWEKNSNFYGDMKTFLFTLYPQAAIYRPSGSNGNLQWCAMNFTSGNIPNGIGFGGQIHHFGLFVSSGFDKGYTRSSITFNNPQLSSESEIIPESIECWGIVIKGENEDEKSVCLDGTILERFKEDRNMLNLVGIANAST